MTTKPPVTTSPFTTALQIPPNAPLEENPYPRPKAPGIHRPERALVPPELYHGLLSLPRHPKQRELQFFRFKIYVVVAYHSGLRIGDIGRLSREQLQSLMDHGRLDLVESKNKRCRKVLFSDSARADLCQFKDGLDIVFQDSPTLMGTEHVRNWARFVNSSLRRLAPANRGYIRSHSFRANYITYLLNKFPIQRVSKHINHSHIDTTMRYDRYQLSEAELLETLDSL